MTFLLRHLEILLTALGLLVIAAAGYVSSRYGADLWMITALTAASVGVVHGLIFWLIRRRQRQVRKATIERVQAMLRDVVNNQLAILRFANDLNARAPGTIAPERINDSISIIASALNTLSEESLQTWQSRYERS